MRRMTIATWKRAIQISLQSKSNQHKTHIKRSYIKKQWKILDRKTKKWSIQEQKQRNTDQWRKAIIQRYAMRLFTTTLRRYAEKPDPKKSYGMEDFAKHFPNEPAKFRKEVDSIQDVAEQYIQTKNISNYLHTVHRRLDDAIYRADFSTKKVMYIIGGIILVLWAFWTSILAFFGDQTSLVASKTLDSEDVHISAQVLTSEVVMGVLTDPSTTNEVINMLRNLINRPETQVLLVDLLIHILKDKRTMAQLYVLVADQLKLLLEDEHTLQLAQTFVTQLIQQDTTKEELIKLVQNVLADPELVAWIQEWTAQQVVSSTVTEAAQDLSARTVSDLLERDELKNQVAQFADDVMSDKIIQQKAGYALWEAVGWAVVPALLKPPPPPPMPLPIDPLEYASTPIPDSTQNEPSL